QRWFNERSSAQELAYLAGRDPRVCGIATVKIEFWQLSRVYIGRPMPIVLLEDVKRPYLNLAPPGRELASINAVIAPSRSRSLLPGYGIVRCKGIEPQARCLYIRPGGCVRTREADEMEAQKVMLKYDY